MRSLRSRAALVRVVLASAIALTLVAGIEHARAQSASHGAMEDELRAVGSTARTLLQEVQDAAVRLPFAAALGTALALRRRRRGTPPRRPEVVQTQIVLAVVGSVVMLIVGTSLARAFGIVGVASLIRYRSKIDDPKDAVVMLSALAVGLAAGAGALALSVFSTAFLVAVLWVIESFEPRTRNFELSVKLGDKTDGLRPRIEAVLRRFKVGFELRAASDEEVSYLVIAPAAMSVDRVSEALTSLVPDAKSAVEWKELARSKVK